MPNILVLGYQGRRVIFLHQGRIALFVCITEAAPLLGNHEKTVALVNNTRYLLKYPGSEGSRQQAGGQEASWHGECFSLAYFHHIWCVETRAFEYGHSPVAM